MFVATIPGMPKYSQTTLLSIQDSKKILNNSLTYLYWFYSDLTIVQNQPPEASRFKYTDSPCIALAT